MATLAELLTVSTNEILVNKIKVAAVIAAEKVRTEAPTTEKHAERLLWAKSVFENPDLETERMIWAVLAQNWEAPITAIAGADDATVISAVSNAVNVFATGA